MTVTNAIRARIDVPNTVEFIKDGDAVQIPVRCELENRADNDFALTAADDDQELFWHVLNEQQREIARKGKSDNAGASRMITVATAHPSHELFTVTIEPRKLRNGRTYTVRVVSYGQPAEGRFIALEVPGKTPRKRATRPKAVKKQAAKKAVGKRPRPKAVKKRRTRKRIA